MRPGKIPFGAQGVLRREAGPQNDAAWVVNFAPVQDAHGARVAGLAPSARCPRSAMRYTRLAPMPRSLELIPFLLGELSLLQNEAQDGDRDVTRMP